MNCPKCGFTQDEDRYCASCGVDMQNYKRPQAVWYLRAATNWRVQLGVVVAVVFVLSALLREKQAALLEAMRTSDTPVLLSKSNAPRAEVAVHDQHHDEAPASADPNLQAAPAAAADSSAVAVSSASFSSSVDGAKPGGSEKSPAANNAPTKLRARFMAAHRSWLQELPTAQTYSFIEKDAEEKIKAASDQGALVDLDTSAEKILSSKEKMLLQSTGNDATGNKYGIMIEFVPAPAGDDKINAHGTVLITRRLLRDPSSVTETLEWRVGKDQAAIWWGSFVQPHVFDDSETKLYEKTVLRIYSPAVFPDGQTELALILHGN